MILNLYSQLFVEKTNSFIIMVSFVVFNFNYVRNFYEHITYLQWINNNLYVDVVWFTLWEEREMRYGEICWHLFNLWMKAKDKELAATHRESLSTSSVRGVLQFVIYAELTECIALIKCSRQTMFCWQQHVSLSV